VTLISLTVGYNFLYWLFFIELRIFDLHSAIPIGAAFILAGLVSYLIFVPRLKILHLERKGKSLEDLYIFVLTIAFAFPMVFTLNYIEKTAGKVTELDFIKEISDVKETKFYTLKNSYIRKSSSSEFSMVETGGRNNQDFHMYIYIVTPIFNDVKDVINPKVSAWLGIKYHKRISNYFAPEKKEELHRKFFYDSHFDFENKKISEFVYLNRIENSDTKRGFIEATKANKFYKTNDTILVAMYEPFEAREGDSLRVAFYFTLGSTLFSLIAILIPKINYEKLEEVKAKGFSETRRKGIQEFLNFCRPREGFFVTPILVYINIIIFLLIIFFGLDFLTDYNLLLQKWGVSYSSVVNDGEYWRLFTSLFINNSFLKLLIITSFLMGFGTILEPTLGKIRYLIAYFGSGILANFVFIFFDNSICHGAAGALFGLLGVSIIMAITKSINPISSKILLMLVLMFVGLLLVASLIQREVPIALIYGILSGLIVGTTIYISLKLSGVENFDKE